MSPVSTRVLDAVLLALADLRADVLVERALHARLGVLRCDSSRLELEGRRVVVLGAGKASAAMARGVERALWFTELTGLVVTKHGHSEPLHRVACVEAGHPVPDQHSLEAGEQLLQMAETCRPNDVVIGLVSGGASALAEALVDGLSLGDLQSLTGKLLRSGAPIQDINAVRRVVSRLKAGGLRRACPAEQGLVLVLSDILGNPLPDIGSGPFWPSDPSAGAQRVASEHGLTLPTQERSANNPEPWPHHVIGDAATCAGTTRHRLAEAGFQVEIVDAQVQGEARELGEAIGRRALAWARSEPAQALLWVGETTVTVRGEGVGGRCQEAACATAAVIDGRTDLAVLCLGTDGTDGPTSSAGAAVDGFSVSVAASRGKFVADALLISDTHAWCAAAEALVETGPTGTNVNDVYIAVHVPPESAPNRSFN